MPATQPPREISIWWFAFGYFAAYAPYSALTKSLSKGLFGDAPLSGPALLPVSVVTSMFGMGIFLYASGWWKSAGRRRVLGREVPVPGLWTFLSGLCTAAIVLTTTLAYTFDGVSIVFVMLLMRGGVLVIAPLVDLVTGRTVRWFSWVGLVISFAALGLSVGGDTSYVVTFACALDIAAYLAAYFVRLRFMSRLAKGSGDDRRFFVEEQMVATPAAVAMLVLVALVGGRFADPIRWGFTEIWSHPGLWTVVLVGVLSQMTGIFGGLILLDKRENTYCVPVNRASSVLAGVVASYGLALVLDQPLPEPVELAGAGLIILAITVLSVPPLLEKRRKAAQQAAAIQPG